MSESFYIVEISSSLLMRHRRKRSTRTKYVNQIFQKREERGEFYHLMNEKSREILPNY